MTREDRMDALHTDIYAEIGYHLGIDDSDDGACDAKNRAALAVLRLIERELADAVDLAAKIEAAWEWIARTEPNPELGGDLLRGLRDALSGRPDRCDRCHRPLPHSEAESRVCVPDVPAARPAFGYVDRETGEPCPTRGNVLCTLAAANDREHLHVAAHMWRPAQGDVPAARDEPEPERASARCPRQVPWTTMRCARRAGHEGGCSGVFDPGPVQVTTPEDKR